MIKNKLRRKRTNPQRENKSSPLRLIQYHFEVFQHNGNTQNKKNINFKPKIYGKQFLVLNMAFHFSPIVSRIRRQTFVDHSKRVDLNCCLN